MKKNFYEKCENRIFHNASGKAHSGMKFFITIGGKRFLTRKSQLSGRWAK